MSPTPWPALLSVSDVSDAHCRYVADDGSWPGLEQVYTQLRAWDPFHTVAIRVQRVVRVAMRRGGGAGAGRLAYVYPRTQTDSRTVATARTIYGTCIFRDTPTPRRHNRDN